MKYTVPFIKETIVDPKTGEETHIERALVTNKERANEPLVSQYGMTTYLEWCHLESERMNKAGGNTLVCLVDGICAVAKV